jgi:hypothetical protein
VQKTCRISLQNVRALQDHQKKERPQPQGTYADALLRTSHKRPPEGEKITASRYLRSRPTTYTSYMITRRRQDPRLEVHSLTPYYVHAIQDHQKKKKILASRYLRSRPTAYTIYKTTRRRKDPSLKVPTFTPYYVHAIKNHRKKNTPQSQGTHARIRYSSWIDRRDFRGPIFF